MWLKDDDVWGCFVKVNKLGNVGWRIRLIFIRDVDAVFVFRLGLGLGWDWLWKIQLFTHLASSS